MEVRTHNGVKLRILNFIDEYPHDCLAVRVGRSLTYQISQPAGISSASPSNDLRPTCSDPTDWTKLERLGAVQENNQSRMASIS